MLRFAGAVADIVGVNASVHSGEVDTAAAQDSLPERIDEKVAWLRQGAGDRFDEIEINAWLAVAELAEVLATVFATDAASVLASPLSLVGAPKEIGERLRERRERWGYSYTVVPGDKARDFAPIVAELTGS